MLLVLSVAVAGAQSLEKLQDSAVKMRNEVRQQYRDLDKKIHDLDKGIHTRLRELDDLSIGLDSIIDHQSSVLYGNSISYTPTYADPHLSQLQAMLSQPLPKLPVFNPDACSGARRTESSRHIVTVPIVTGQHPYSSVTIVTSRRF